MDNQLFFQSIDDLRGYLDEYPDPRQWRLHLRKKLWTARGSVSDLTKRPCIWGFDLHEGLFSRKYVPKTAWQALLFAGPNCFILSPDEHIPEPPDRVTCYWLSVIRYGKARVDQWIGSLPFKSGQSFPWKGTNCLDIISQIPEERKVASSWFVWFNNVQKHFDIEG